MDEICVPNLKTVIFCTMNCPSCGTHNPEPANFCSHCGRALKPTDRPRSFVEWLQGGAPTEGERRQVTILACDTVASSLLAEGMDPEEFLDLMNRAFEAILAPVFAHGGYLARLEGDGFKAFFGAPEAHEDDPLRAVRAGLEIQTAARRIGEQFMREDGVPGFAVRVGVHTDHVVVGPVGTGDTVEYTAMGIGIVLAARLESIARPGTVLISEATQRLIEPYVEVVPLGPTQVKGRSQPVHVFEVTGLRTAAEWGEALGVRSPLVGRAMELATLRGAVERLVSQPEPAAGAAAPPMIDWVATPGPQGAADASAPGVASVRRGSIVHIVGEAGVGKSRLMRHVRNEMTAKYPQLIWLDGRALNRSHGAYGVLADLLQSYLGIGVDDRMADMWAKLRHRMTHLFAPRAGRAPTAGASPEGGEAEALIPHLGNLLSLRLEGEAARRVSDLDPEAQERQIFRALRRLCERLTDDGPLALVLDDLQGADDGAIRLLEDLMHLIDERPICFIFALRPVPGAACWRLREAARRAYPRDAVEIVLHSLPTRSSNELIENLLEIPDGEELSEGVRALIQDRSGGNPLFIEEVVRSLIDRGALERSGSRWHVVGEVPANYIPGTLHGVISARLDRLEPESRRTLQLAAVIGRTFSYRVLQAVSPNGRDLGVHLGHLQRAELVRELRRGTEQAYIFTHALTQQVAYETLLLRQRRDYHRRVAECIEALYADRLEEQFERLAHHYTSAEAWAPALDYHIKFANQAQLRYANGKAAEHYQLAWEIVQSGRAGGEETQRLLCEAQGNLDFLAGDYPQAVSRYQTALELTDDVIHRARLLRKLGNVCQASGDYGQGIRYLEQGLELAVGTKQGPELASLYAGLGQIYHRQGKYQQAAELGSRSLDIFEGLEDRAGTALASNLLGITYWAMGELDTARTFHEKNLSIHASLGDVHGLAASYNNLGRVLADQGQLEWALHNFRQSQRLCLEIGHQHGLATALSHLSELYQRLGQTDEAWACQEKAFEIYNRIGFDGLQVQPEVLKMQVW
jgi:class 3 adenylate cyclase/predicted ATPase